MPTPTYIPLATITLTSTDSEIVFSSIPATYRDLILIVSGSPADNTYPSVLGRVNGNSSSIYFGVRMTGNGTSAASSISYNAGTYIDLGTAFGAGPNTSSRFNVVAQYMDYSATDKQKTILARTDTPSAGTQAAASRWASTDAINTISVVTSGGAGFAVGSTFSLYGVN